MQEKTLLEEIREDIKNPKPKETAPTKKKRKYTAQKLIALMLLIALVSIEAIAIFWCVWAWGQYNILNVRSPLIMQSPVVWNKKQVEAQEARIKPEPIDPKTKQEIIYGGGYGDIVSKFHILESGGGTAPEGHHRECEQQGKSNEFGYFAGGNRNFCFETFEDSVEEISRWLESNLNEMPLPIVVCYYNTGVVKSDCEYLQSYNAL